MCCLVVIVISSAFDCPERLISEMTYVEWDVNLIFFFFFLRMRLRPIVGQPGSSSIISRVGQTTIQLRKRAGFDDVGHRLGLTTGANRSVSVRHHVFLQAPQCP